MKEWMVAIIIGLLMQASGGAVPPAGTTGQAEQVSPPAVAEPAPEEEQSCVQPAVEGPEPESHGPERPPRGGIPNIDTGGDGDGRTAAQLQGDYADYHDYFSRLFGPDWYLQPDQVQDRPAAVEDTEQYRYFYNQYAVDCQGTGSRIRDFLEEHFADSEWGGMEYFEYGSYPYESDIYIYVTDDDAREKAVRLLREEYRPTPVDRLGRVQVVFYRAELSVQRQQEMLQKLDQVLAPKATYTDHGDYYEEMRFRYRVFEPDTEAQLPKRPYILVTVRLSIVDPDELAEQKAYATRLVEDLVRANGWERHLKLEYDIAEDPLDTRPNPDT